MGYIEDADFDFDVIRHKYPYAERHHIGQTYEWKYFYSTTFEITNELIQYLLRHNFIKDKNATTLSSAEQKEQVLMSWEDVIKHNTRKIKKFEEEEAKFRAKGQIESADNLLKAIENCKKKIENVKEIMEKTEI